MQAVIVGEGEGNHNLVAAHEPRGDRR
jgi:hypothetical protein